MSSKYIHNHIITDNKHNHCWICGGELSNEALISGNRIKKTLLYECLTCSNPAFLISIKSLENQIIECVSIEKHIGDNNFIIISIDYQNEFLVKEEEIFDKVNEVWSNKILLKSKINTNKFDEARLLELLEKSNLDIFS